MTAKKGIRLWFWLMIVGPAILLLYFFIYSDNEPSRQAEKYPLPASYEKLGRAADINGGNYTAGPGEKVFFTGELHLGNNTVAAEAGTTFLVIPLQMPSNKPDPAPENWWVLDSNGFRYSLLKVLSTNPVENKNGAGAPEGFREAYQIFKVNKKENLSFYLVY